MPAMRIVIAGGTGFLGRPLVESLVADGYALTVLTRRPQSGRGAAAEVQWQPDGRIGRWATAVDGADAVINLAGESIAGRRWSERRKAAITNSRLSATRSLVAAVERASRRPALLVSSSAVGYYGARGDEIVTEADGPGSDFLARLAVEWERAAEAALAPDTRVVLLRSGLVLAADGGALKPMLLPFRLGIGGPVGSGRQYWPWIHRADWIALMRFVLSHPSASGPVNATAPAPVSNAEFSRTLGRVLGRPSLLRAPAFALRALMGEMAVPLVLTGQRVVPARALEMGFRFEYESLEHALREILR